MSKQILGLAYHSPLIVQMLPPPQHYQTVLLLSASPKDVRIEVDAALKKLGKLQLVIMAGSVEIAQVFFRLYPELPHKLVLFDFPGLIQPAHSTMNPLISWLDCDHQAGGAWQTKKIKPESFSQHLERVQVLGPEGRDLINAMDRFVPRDRLNEIEAIQEYLPENYKSMIASETKEEEKSTEIEISSFSLRGVIDYFAETLTEAARSEVSDRVVDFLLRKLAKRDFNTTIGLLIKDDKEAKSRSLVLKRWIENADLGVKLFWTYLDYVVNYPTRSWDTILKDGYAKEPDDLKMLLARQPKTAHLPKGYTNEIKKVSKLPRTEHTEGAVHHEAMPWGEVFKS